MRNCVPTCSNTELGSRSDRWPLLQQWVDDDRGMAAATDTPGRTYRPATPPRGAARATIPDRRDPQLVFADEPVLVGGVDGGLDRGTRWIFGTGATAGDSALDVAGGSGFIAPTSGRRDVRGRAAARSGGAARLLYRAAIDAGRRRSPRGVSVHHRAARPAARNRSAWDSPATWLRRRQRRRTLPNHKRTPSS